MSKTQRKAKIVCTLGPASDSVAMIRTLARAGMNVARLNFSHGDHAYHQKLIDNIRKVNTTLKDPVLIMQDLEGYRIRIGHLDKPIILKEGESYWVGTGSISKKNVLPLDCDFDIQSLKKEMHVFIADGTIDLLVVGHTGKFAKLKVVHGGTVVSKKNVNIPGMKLHSNIFTQKDEQDLKFGIANKVDMVAQSFVRNKRDIDRIVKAVRPHLPKCKVISKIESTEALRNLDKILDACDGIIIARGDLGVSLPIHQVPVWQKKILLHSNRKNKIDMTATQMLETMIDHPRPTRAEVNDVANAVLDGSGYVMLSGETAVGRFPAEAVTMMRKVIEYTEMEMRTRNASGWISPNSFKG